MSIYYFDSILTDFTKLQENNNVGELHNFWLSLKSKYSLYNSNYLRKLFNITHDT